MYYNKRYEKIFSKTVNEKWLVKCYDLVSIKETYEDDAAISVVNFNNDKGVNILAICKNPRSEESDHELQSEAVLSREGNSPKKLDNTRQQIIDHIGKNKIQKLYIADAVPKRTFSSNTLNIGADVSLEKLTANFNFIEDLIEKNNFKKILLLTGDLYKVRSDKKSYKKSLYVLHRLKKIIKNNESKIYILSITNEGFPRAISRYSGKTKIRKIKESDIAKVDIALKNYYNEKNIE